jgi:hypothetical protein
MQKQKTEKKEESQYRYKAWHFDNANVSWQVQGNNKAEVIKDARYFMHNAHGIEPPKKEVDPKDLSF